MIRKGLISVTLLVLFALYISITIKLQLLAESSAIVFSLFGGLGIWGLDSQLQNIFPRYQLVRKGLISVALLIILALSIAITINLQLLAESSDVFSLFMRYSFVAVSSTFMVVLGFVYRYYDIRYNSESTIANSQQTV